MENLKTLTEDELRHNWRILCRRHDNLVDNAPMGDDRIYQAQKDMDRIETELRERGLSPHGMFK